MQYDPRVPNQLREIQEWFAGTILQKMGTPFSLVGSQNLITTTQELSATKRMQIYHEAYWFRLIDALQEEFPMLVRLFGEEGFTSTFAIEYLDKYPPRHWSLNLIGDRFINWLQENYRESDKKLIEICAGIDWACQQIFLANRDQPCILCEAKPLISTEVALQPTIFLFCLPGHFMKWRKELLKHSADHWEKTPFPQLLKDKTYYFILYRSPSLTVEWEEVCCEKYLLLQFISELGTIERAADRLEEMEDINQELVEKSIVGWIEAILSYGWLRRKT